MTPAASKRLVLVSLSLMGGVVAIKDLSGRGLPGSTFTRYWALGAVGLVLSVVADFAPQIAGPLAALMAVGYLAGADGAITSFVHGAVGEQRTVAADPVGAAHKGTQ